MTTYIGTATSRVDGRAKVTGAAKFAGEFITPGLAHASLVTATIAKGRVSRIDANEALAVEGVIEVLTHRNRPRMAPAWRPPPRRSPTTSRPASAALRDRSD